MANPIIEAGSRGLCYEVKKIEYHDPKRVFECVRCDREGMVVTKGIKRRFEVTLATLEGKEERFCVVCASILTGKRQGELMKAGREGACCRCILMALEHLLWLCLLKKGTV